MTNLPNIPRLYTALAEVLAVLLYAQPLPLRLKPKTLANGLADTGEFLEVDTTKLPAKTREVTLAVTVGG